MYLRELCGREEGAPPPVDLIEERENGDFVRALILDGMATAAHDVSDGGLLVALAEMAMASGIGATLDAAPDDIPAHAFWFGEDQARYVVTVPAARCEAVLERAAGGRACRCGHWHHRRRRIDASRRAAPPGHDACASVSRAGCRPIWPASRRIALDRRRR